jgi:hypothetical protein
VSTHIEAWSCGGGTQSGAIATLIGTGKLPRPDVAFMTNTGREKSGTWPFVDGFIRPQLAKVGLDLTLIQSVDFGGGQLWGGEDGNTVLLPGFTTLSGQVGKLSPFCSGSWKTDIGERFLRSIGADTARNWIGISMDEMRRVRKQHRPWLELWYPLIFAVRMWRSDCVALVRSTGWDGPIPHSACKMCPNMQDGEWIDMQQNFPADFVEACEIEAEIRLRDPHFYLHESCVPLGQVNFFAQSTMFSERGCIGGCFT